MNRVGGGTRASDTVPQTLKATANPNNEPRKALLNRTFASQRSKSLASIACLAGKCSVYLYRLESLNVLRYSSITAKLNDLLTSFVN